MEQEQQGGGMGTKPDIVVSWLTLMYESPLREVRVGAGGAGDAPALDPEGQVSPAGPPPPSRHRGNLCLP